MISLIPLQIYIILFSVVILIIVIEYLISISQKY